MTQTQSDTAKRLVINKFEENAQAIQFCHDYLNAKPQQRYVFGRNEWAQSVAELVDVEFFIDDFTEDSTYLGKPIIKTEDISPDALVVVSVALGRPLTAAKKLSDNGIRHSSYFEFYQYSGLDLLAVTFWDRFEADFRAHEDKYRWIFDRLEDDESKRIFERILNFRLSADLAYMSGFTDRQKEQYFEDFLELKVSNEVFVDVGGFDGFTSLEFIRRCPDYRGVYFFEPELKNMDIAKSRLSGYEDIHFLQKGLSNKHDIVRFSIGGSSSAISTDGEIEIKVDALDNLIDAAVTFIKMDIEGAEGLAIEGARQTIASSHPKLAICVYHKADDMWKIAEQVLSIRDDYKIFLRHYTEGVTETVMFFVPN
jgi:FkbM family methyltransferase